MNTMKLNLMVAAIKLRMEQEDRQAGDLLNEYTKLTTAEKDEIFSALET